MNDRVASSRTPNAVNLAGSLGESLRHHALERCRHFFLYLFVYKALTDRLNDKFKLNLGNAEGVDTAATHQVDVGEDVKKAKNAAVRLPFYYGFDRTDPDVVNKSATAASEYDASHYCNLGIEAEFRARIAQHAVDDRIAFDLYEMLKAICGNTKWLPKAININPDRRIDILHGTLARKMLDGKPPVSATNRRTYIDEARKEMKLWRDKYAKRDQHGLAACTEAYFGFYNDPEQVQLLWTTLTGNVMSECSALGLVWDRYLRRTVR